MEIDPRFKAARARSAQRRRNAVAVPVVLWVAGILALGGIGAALYFGGVVTLGTPDHPIDVADDAAPSTYVSAFVDLAGDPMVLRFDTGAAQKTRKLLRPIDIPADRAGNELSLLTDDLITGEEKLITTLPSSREDFAYFQAQRTAQVALPKPQLPSEQPAETVVVADGDASWGENMDGTTTPETYVKTRIENTTSVNFILPEAQRKPPYQDTFLRLKDTTDLAGLMAANGMEAGAAKRFADAAALLVPEFASLGPGKILAMRAANRSGVMVPVQASLYTKTDYFGSVAVNDAGSVVTSADPWVEEDLFSFAGDQGTADVDTSRKYRMLDTFYSAAIRNGVPSAVVAETIVMMSQAFDMDSFAAPGDKMILLYSKDAGTGGSGPGQVLYAAIRGEGKVLECHVFKPVGKEDFACFVPGGVASSGGGVSLRAGMVTPAKGVLTSRFGPRMHPILKVLKLHRGTDWAAPSGTPVMAAFDGTVLLAGDGGSYGNLVKLSHAGGTETRYAHLSAFADGIKAGDVVAAGQLIGYIGTTGQSTGPHLHFELYENGEAVDPLAAGGTMVAEGGGSAVETLVDQIIRVESGGKADAKNPLSTATGLGQFIESTWIRMMGQYRPDLASTMGRAELLALRNDPTISREMVTALAREGESYLRARGHGITAGRLYLCHFLGAEGANMVLKAQDDQLVGDVMGSGVVKANPFLSGRTIAYVKEWAELKMSRKGGASLPAVAVTPPEVLAYQKIIAGILGTPI
ncbi:M23 family metallopeptidase [Cypionkella sp.]|uniref:M23 family metallopeptidase n=1 Tax=Cypionkella sp. TaxID=2811411 RepID=UPI002ABB5D75|nr:M23 family metallopeptidase [Cypionkella sp.]MDZ4395166.1 M23 family metallopeptidase [Cypionkella sp.]